MQKLSVIVPAFCEEEVIETSYQRLKNALSALSGFDSEIIFIDDGSSDRTLDHLRAIAGSDAMVKVLSFSRNFGHQVALSAGIDRAGGDAVVIIDADLQDPPEFIPDLIRKWQEGYQVVYAIRKKRKEGFLKKAAYSIFYRMLRRLSNIDIPVDTGDFCLIDRTIVQHLKRLPERNRFVRGLRSWIGYKQIGLEYERDRRFAGEVKYTMGRLMKLAFDGFISFSNVPLRLASLFGFIVSSLSFLGGAIVIFSKYVADYTPQGWTSTLVIVFFLGGIQLITIGIIGEYIGRIYDEVKQRPLYIVREEINFG